MAAQISNIAILSHSEGQGDSLEGMDLLFLT